MANPSFLPMNLGNETPTTILDIISRKQSGDCDEEKVLNLNHSQNGLGNSIGRCCPHYENQLICTNRYCVQNLCNKIHAKLSNEDEISNCNQQPHEKSEATTTGDFEKVKGDTTVQCPHCKFILDLSLFSESPQVFCHYCGTIFRKNKGMNYEMRACERCGFYINSKPHKFPFSYYQSNKCKCFRPQRNMSKNEYNDNDGNVSLCQECLRKKEEHHPNYMTGIINFCCPENRRSQVLSMETTMSTKPNDFDRLEQANALVKDTTYDEDDIDDAIDIYKDLLKGNQTEAAGIRYNMGLAYMTKCDWRDAISIIESSFTNCSNFEPAYYALSECYKHVDTSCGNLAQLQKQFATVI